MDNNNMNSEILNVGFMGSTTTTTAPNGAPEQQSKKPTDFLGMKLKLGSLEIPVIALGAAALVVLSILISLISGAVENGNVKKALMTYAEDPEEVYWDKYYPDKIADAIDDYVKDYRNLRIDNYGKDAKIKILSSEKLSGKSKELLTEAVLQFINLYDADMRKRDIKVSKGYMVTYSISNDRYEALGVALIIKVNGRYGVYKITELVQDY